MARVKKIDNAILKQLKYQKPQRKPQVIRCRILIVCEGAKTEPGYFHNFHQQQRGTIIYDIDTDGGGINTLKVVQKAIDLRDRACDDKKPYDSVWAVFDRDSFPCDNFDNAVRKCHAQDIRCAWSNEAFELWYLLHFRSVTQCMGRDEYKNALSEAVTTSAGYKKKKKPYVYAKNDPKNYEIMTQLGDQEQAIKRAQEMAKNFNDHCYHTHNPLTTVCDLVLLLIGRDEQFNEQIRRRIESQSR